MQYRVVETIPTNNGRSVHVAISQGRRVLVKRAHTPEWAQDLREQTHHYRTLNELLGDDSVYPEVLHAEDDVLIMPFYDGGTVDELSLLPRQELVRQYTAVAVDHLFGIATRARDIGGGSGPREDMAHTFVKDQLDKRLGRLEQALDGPAAEWAQSRHTDGRPRPEVLATATKWTRTAVQEDAAGRLGPVQLGLASHGDFGLNNVMLKGQGQNEGGDDLVFIDTRGLWIDDLPWWDPVLDLATLLTFHCRIEPALAGLGELPQTYQSSRGRLSETEILAVVEDSRSAQAWLGDDPGWRERLEVMIGLRLLGAVSVQLLTAPQRQEERASAVLDLLLQQAHRIQAALGARR